MAIYRIRVGKYRVVYDVDKKNRIVNVTKIGRRKDTYDWAEFDDRKVRQK